MMKSEFIKKEVAAVLRSERADLSSNLYNAAKELRKDLQIIFNRYAAYCDPEVQYVAMVSIQDDLDTFMKAMKRANVYLKENHSSYLTPYDDYLGTRGGQYALAKEVIAVMDEISFAERRGAKEA